MPSIRDRKAKTRRKAQSASRKPDTGRKKSASAKPTNAKRKQSVRIAKVALITTKSKVLTVRAAVVPPKTKALNGKQGSNAAKTRVTHKNGATAVEPRAPTKIAKRTAEVVKPSQLAANGKSGTGVNGTRAGHMDSNGAAAEAAKGKLAKAQKSKGSSKRLRQIVLPPDYRPSESEPFMNEMQRIYFRNKLMTWKDDILRQNMETLKGLHDESAQQADPADRATAETDRALELRARDRQRKLMSKIASALSRIEEGSYGYCEETGEPINLRRLDARPIATLSLEAQERRERRERVFREE